MTDNRTTDGVTVGKFYRVPAVRVARWHGWRDIWIAVIGPKHEDAEIVGFPWQHFHVDWRFVQRRIFDQLSWIRGPTYVHAYPIQDPDGAGTKVILEGPVLRRMKCKRTLAGPFPREAAHWIPKLEEKFACARLVNGLCPHRGIPVSAMHRDGDVLTCPGHGLRWSATTGELIR